MSVVKHLSIETCVFSQDGKTMATACRNGGIKVWDLPTSKLLYSLFCDSWDSEKNDTNVIFDPNKEFLIATRENVVFVWNLVSGKIWQEFSFGYKCDVDSDMLNWFFKVECMAFSLNGMRLAMASKDLLNIYQKTTPNKKPVCCIFELLTNISLNYTIIQNTKLFFTGTDTIAVFGGENIVYDVTNGKLLSKIENVPKESFCANTISKNNRYLASIEEDTVSIYALSNTSCKLVNCFKIVLLNYFHYEASISFVFNDTMLMIKYVKSPEVNYFYLINFLTGQTIQKLQFFGTTNSTISNSENLSIALTEKNRASIVNVSFNRTILCIIASVLHKKNVFAFVTLNIVNFCLAFNYFLYSLEGLRSSFRLRETSFEGESQFLHFLKYNAIEKIKTMLKK